MTPPRACPLCAAHQPREWLRKPGLRVVRCQACGMAYADPLPPESSTAAYDRLGQPYYLSPDKLEGDYAAVRFTREIRLLHRVCRAGTILDVGCGSGAFLHELRRRFPGAYRGMGIDVSRAALEFARSRGVEALEGSFPTQDFGGLRFDAITFWAVLEHLPDPAVFVRRAAELLVPGGHCVALVPNLRSLACRTLGARYRYLLPQHVNYFTAPSLEGLFTRAGLAPCAAGGSHFNPVVLWQDWRRGTDAPVPEAQRAALLRRTTRWKQSVALAPAAAALRIVEKSLAAAGLADNIWVIGRRP